MKRPAKRLTFSIATRENEITGRLYRLAKKLDLTVVSVYRHNLSIFDLLLSEAYEELFSEKVGTEEEKQEIERRKIIFRDTVSTIAMSTVIREEGLRSNHKERIAELLKSVGRPDLVDFVVGLTTLQLALLIDRARYQVSRFDDDFDDDEDTETEEETLAA